MHSPSLMTSTIATGVIASHTNAATDSRLASQRRALRLRRRRRAAAFRDFVPRGRTVPPFAH